MNGMTLNQLKNKTINRMRGLRQEVANHWREMVAAEAPAGDMARAFTAEVQKIAAAQEAGATKEAAMPEALRKSLEAKAAKGGKAPAKEEKKPAFLKKKASAIDLVAAERALAKIASESNFDVEEARTRLSAVLVLGPAESEKIAHVPDYPAAIEVRALELLEQAGYEVVWNQA